MKRGGEYGEERRIWRGEANMKRGGEYGEERRI